MIVDKIERLKQIAVELKKYRDIHGGEKDSFFIGDYAKISITRTSVRILEFVVFFEMDLISFPYSWTEEEMDRAISAVDFSKIEKCAF